MWNKEMRRALSAYAERFEKLRGRSLAEKCTGVNAAVNKDIAFVWDQWNYVLEERFATPAETGREHQHRVAILLLRGGIGTGREQHSHHRHVARRGGTQERRRPLTQALGAGAVVPPQQRRLQLLVHVRAVFQQHLHEIRDAKLP